MENLQNDGLWINLGSSNLILPGWENLDRTGNPGTRLCDVRLGLPFPTGSARVIVTSHVIEHLHPTTEVPSVLRECVRVLRPGGTIRIAVPDLEILLRCYTKKEWSPVEVSQSELQQYVGVSFTDMPACLKFSAVTFGNGNPNAASYDGHQAVWDFEGMKWTLERAGFSTVSQVVLGSSRDPDLPKRYTDNWAEQSL